MLGLAPTFHTFITMLVTRHKCGGQCTVDIGG